MPKAHVPVHSSDKTGLFLISFTFEKTSMYEAPIIKKIPSVNSKFELIENPCDTPKPLKLS